jgi:hypothetical protein
MLTELKSVRQSVDQRLRSLSLIKDALIGKLDSRAYCRYLSLIANQYSQHSPKVMCLAASRCITTHPELGTYLLKHAAEERGHNDWAYQDRALQ